MTDPTQASDFQAVESDPDEPRLTVKFNPFAFTVEENNEFIRKGYEPHIVTGVLNG